MILAVLGVAEATIPRVLVTSHKRPLLALPAGLRANIETWQSLNPEWVFQYFDDTEQRDFVAEKCSVPRCLEAYDLLVSGAARADVFRIAFLYYQGGFWFDSDVKPGRLLQQCDLNVTENLFLVREPKRGHVRYMVIGGKGHPFLRANLLRQIDNIFTSKQANRRAGALTITGPFTLGKTLCQARDINQYCSGGYFTGTLNNEQVPMKWARSFGTPDLRFRYDTCLGYWHRPGARGLVYREALAAMNITHHTQIEA